MKTLSNVNPATLHLLKKLVAAACKETREGLGQTAGEFAVDETIVLHAQGTVKVAKSSMSAANAQRAQPWSLLVALETLANERLGAAGLTGIDLATVVEAAKNIDPKLSEKAAKDAEALMADKRVSDRKFKWGGVTPKGTVEVTASGNHLEAEPEGEPEGESEAG
jgi:hypothetical protein